MFRHRINSKLSELQIPMRSVTTTSLKLRHSVCFSDLKNVHYNGIIMSVMTSQITTNSAVFSCDQAALRTLLSVRRSVCLSVRLLHLFSQCSSHCIIMEISGVIAIAKSDVHAKSIGQRSKVDVTEVKKTTLSQFRHFRVVTPYKRYPIVFQGHPSNLKVTWDKKSSILTRIGRFRTVIPVWIDRWLWNDT